MIVKFFVEWWKAFDKEIDAIANRANIFPILAVAIAAVSTAATVGGGIIQSNAARKAERSRRGAEELEAQRQRLQAVREARIRRAETAAAAESQGASGSSGAEGAQASIGTQLAANLGFVQSQTRANREISAANLQANRGAQIAQLGQAVGQVGQAFQNYQQRNAQAAAIEERNSATRVN